MSPDVIALAVLILGQAGFIWHKLGKVEGKLKEINGYQRCPFYKGGHKPIKNDKT